MAIGAAMVAIVGTYCMGNRLCRCVQTKRVVLFLTLLTLVNLYPLHEKELPVRC